MPLGTRKHCAQKLSFNPITMRRAPNCKNRRRVDLCAGRQIEARRRVYSAGAAFNAKLRVVEQIVHLQPIRQPHRAFTRERKSTLQFS